MAIFTGTTQTFQMVGIREDLSDVITNISPMDTPFFSMCRKGTAKNRTPEWQIDSLGNPNGGNAVIEGNDITSVSTLTATSRIKNITQLFDKTVAVSDTAQAVNAAGRSNELKYEVAKRGKELKRDIEVRISGNYSGVLGNTSTAGQMAGAEAWFTTNTNRGSGGGNGGFNSGTGLTVAATDGTARTFTETLLKDVIKQAWNSGGEPSVIMMSGSKKQTASTFTGIATQFNQVNDQNKVMIYGAADVYKSDFGQHKLVPNRFVGGGVIADGSSARSSTNGLFGGNSVLVMSPEYWELKFLQAITTVPLARTGHAEKRLLKAELTLACKQEAANGVVADLS